MSTPEPIYSGEALLRNWSETANGKRRIVLEIEDNGGAHPFKGYEGERFAVVVMGPLANADHAAKNLAGEVATRKDARAEAVEPAADALRTSPAKPKKRWLELPHSQRAALRMNDNEFQEYAARQTGLLATATTADYFIKRGCRVESKADIVHAAAERFDAIEGEFQAWRIAKGHGAIA